MFFWNEIFIFVWHKSTGMIIIFVLIGFSIIAAAVFITLFIWAVKNGQYDDDYTPSVRILFDDKPEEDSASEL
jgi:cbb3-type cytochrome oxidase maturation protein